MGPLSVEVGQGIRTKGQWVGRMQKKRAGNVVSVSTLCHSRLYCHEKGILKTINKTYWARARLKFWDGDGKKKQKGVVLGKKHTACRKFGYVVKRGAFGSADKFECSFCQPR